jgi:Zn-dependent protease with chaperone function
MKQQVQRFSVHQNAKVFAVLMALSSLIFLVPFVLLMLASAPPAARPPLFFFVFAPLMYLVMGYIMVAAGCAIYNFMFKHIGGIEFESTPGDA